jgi:hypothetical protein
MRIRGTKPDFWRSERIASVDWEDRLVLKGLESYVDDNGVGKDDIALIVGDLFQRDLVREPSRTLARVSEAISRLNKAGLVWRYEANGTALLFVSFWEQVQRVDKPQPGRFPRPDGTMNYKQSSIRESDKNIREPSRTFAPVLEEQGNRGTGEKEPPYPPNDETPPPRTTRHANEKRVGRSHAATSPPYPSRSLDAYRIAEAFSAPCPSPSKPDLLSGIGVQIDKCLKRGIPPPAIAAGLQAWNDSDSWSPTQIAELRPQGQQPPPPPPTASPPPKPSDTTQALAELLQEVHHPVNINATEADLRAAERSAETRRHPRRPRTISRQSPHRRMGRENPSTPALRVSTSSMGSKRSTTAPVRARHADR